MKQFLAGVVAGAVLATTAGAVAAGVPFRLIFNGSELTSVPVTTDDRGGPWVAAVPFARALGADARWDAATGQLVVNSAPADTDKIASYLWGNIADPTVPLSFLAVKAQGYKGVILQLDGDWVVASPRALKDFADGKITSDQFLFQSRFLKDAARAAPNTDGAAMPAPTAGNTGTAIPKGAILVASDGTYLGLLTGDKFHSDSICNEFGKHGSKFQSQSIWNEFGTYGGRFSAKSPFNEFASDPPIIVSGDKPVGYLTVSATRANGVSPLGICQLLQAAGN